MNIVGIGGSFAALNGNTSGLRERYEVEDATGARSPIVGTNDNQNYKDAGIVRPDAENSAIDSWWSDLNALMLERCD